jgi:hypothetical protein
MDQLLNGAANRLPRAPKARKPRKASKGKAMVPKAPRLALGITVGAGIGIPALTLGLSTMAGHLASAGHYLPAAAALAIGCTVLTVSLAHLAWAIGDITRSPCWASWLLAVAVDCSIVLSETVAVAAPGVCDGLSAAILITVTAASMALNVWAFLRHR